MNNFEKLLYTKTSLNQLDGSAQNDSELFSFWKILKRQLSEKLKAVSLIFPHYSLHDSSHSERILDVIWKMFGEESLKTLSVTNIFAILVSAYSHDLGMVVDSDDLDEVFNTEDFINIVKDIKDSKDNPNHKYAEIFDIRENRLFYKSNIKLDKDTYNADKYLLSIYFRSKHAERSEKEIGGILSGYKAYIKSSVMYQIGRICQAHGIGFKSTLEIPREENGIYDDSWNPLFVACALRLGDLLDMESDRFSEAYWESLPTRPYDSEFHKQKHESIRHFVVNTKIIEASAVCKKDYNVYELLVDEFQMVKDEIANQMSHWNQIAPTEKFPGLPCLGNFLVELEEYETFDDGKIPSFHINQNKAFELIQGKGIYGNKFKAIREILQNAVDATIIKVFLENENQDDNLDFYKFNEKLANEKISINISKYKDKNNAGGNGNSKDKECKSKITENKKEADEKNVDSVKTIKWNVTVSDNGIGMDKEDLKYLLDAASSVRNPFKRNIISRMETWMQPSGYFGLGFQSIFLLSKEIIVTTRKINSPVTYELTLQTPSRKNSRVYLKPLKFDFSRKAGTSVSFDFEVPVVPHSLGVSIDTPSANKLVSNFDFVTDGSLDYEVQQMLDAIARFASNSMIPIELKVEENDSVLIERNVSDCYLDSKFYKEYDFELLVPKTTIPLRYLFRNVVISKTESTLFFVPFAVNIFSRNAKEILKIDRDDFLDTEKVYEIRDNTAIAGRKYIIENYDKLPEDMKFRASMYVNYYDFGDTSSDNFESELFRKWEDYKPQNDESDITLKNMVDFDSVVRLIIKHGGSYRNSFTVEKVTTDENEEIVIKTEFNIAEELHLLIKKMFKVGKCVLLSNYNNKECVYEFYKPQNDDGKIKFIGNYEVWFRNALAVTAFFSRFVMPCSDKYLKLAVTRKKTWIPIEETFRFLINDFPCHDFIPIMISPYILEREDAFQKHLKLSYSEKLVDFTYENRLDESVSRDEIAELFGQFIDETKSAVESINNERMK